MENNLTLLIPPGEIKSLVEKIAQGIRADYAAKRPVLIGVLKGAFVFISDLARAAGLPVEVDFVQAASYAGGSKARHEVLIINDITMDINGRDVIVVEGIIDSGRTVKALLEHFSAKAPASIRVCALLSRNGGSSQVRIDYSGKGIDKGFVAGYGMDYKEKYRNLPGIYIVEE